MTGFLLSAPQSGAGKTIITLSLLRALKKRGIAISPYKAGPDYLDPLYHQEAAQCESVNLDCWAMNSQRIRGAVQKSLNKNHLIVVEGMMGLFDGAAYGEGSSADLASLLQLPIILIVDCARQSHSIAALVRGFATHRKDVMVSAIILNKVASARHEMMLRGALEQLPIPILGAVYREKTMELASRHLGLIQPFELKDFDQFIKQAAEMIEKSIDIDVLLKLVHEFKGAELNGNENKQFRKLAPLGNHIAIAKDCAFSFNYRHIIDDWRQAGAEISFFSPVNDEEPLGQADAIYLGGGYPELYVNRLESATRFKNAMRTAAARDCLIYGECGGFMVLGSSIEDEDGIKRQMLGLLPIETSFKIKKLHLGYRSLRPTSNFVWNCSLRGHEFHYSSITHQGEAAPLFYAKDAFGEDLGPVGMRRGSVAGSYIHIIDTHET